MNNIEELIDEIYRLHGYTVGRNDFKKLIDVFFESNVCVPRGEQRHPYADVFHEAMEDITKVIQFEDGHAGRDWTNLHLATDREHRIKPSEPIYEYLFYSPEGSTKWMTIKESEIDVYFIQAKETKRERK